MRRRSIARLLLPALVLTPCALLQVPAAGVALEELLPRILEEERARAATPGMAAAVFSRERLLAVAAVGLADREAQRPMEPETMVPAASVSKLFTAALVLQQVELGRLDLDEDIRSYLPEESWLRDAGGSPVSVTLRQLLSHGSGLPVSWVGIFDLGDRPDSLEEHVTAGLRVAHPPGTRVIYSNAAFSLAGYLAASAAGQGFEAHAEESLLRPLAMAHSTFEPPERAAQRGQLAAGYGSMTGAPQRVDLVDLSPNAPAGSLIATAPDLARFGRMLLRGGELDGARLLAPESVEEMMRPVRRTHPELAEGFALGFGVRDRPGWRFVWWDGTLPGSAARLALLPDHGLGVAILANLSDNGPTSVAARRILEELVPAPPLPRAEVDPAALAALAGTYRLRDAVDPRYGPLAYFATFELRPEAQGLLMRSRFTGEARLLPMGDGRFRVRGSVLDDADVIVRDGEATLGFLTAQRIPFWQTPRVILATAGAALVLALGAVLLLTWWLVRVRRLRQGGGVARPAPEGSRPPPIG